MPQGYGTYLSVTYGWHRTLPINEQALQSVFDSIRSDAIANGCHHYPCRDDLATNEALLEDVISRYESITRQSIPEEHKPHFRRWILLIYKQGGTPN